jgi:hypothetical protein
MADDISSVNLPPIASTGDAPPHDSHRGSNDGNKKKKNPDEPKNESAGQNKGTGSPQPEAREKKPPSSDVDFERTEHELDSFA